MKPFLSLDSLKQLQSAAVDRDQVSGWTHNFYRYPARFSPKFAAAAIDCLSSPGDLVLDPYMGGGTVVVESLAKKRRVIGNDINSLATFVAAVKTTPLDAREIRAIQRWARVAVPKLSYRLPATITTGYMQPEKMKNLDLPRARFIKKVVAAAIGSMASLPTSNAMNFARCAVLRTSQWALDGRRNQTRLDEFRTRVTELSLQMLNQLDAFAAQVRPHLESCPDACVLSHGDASQIERLPSFAAADNTNKASLVITSPPYPGVHVLYHRWQVDGRRESPAPYWIINGSDGQSAAYYTFGDRRQSTVEPYFATSLRTLCAIRKVVKNGGFMVQLVAFSDPETQLPRYLSNMAAAGFTEVDLQLADGAGATARIWREVPNRKWHAAVHGRTHSSREVVLIHRAT